MSDSGTHGETKSLVLGGGCFWCLEAVFERVEGVTDVTSGYAGGRTPDPDYDSVCSGMTGHAEVVRITFDSSRVSLEQLLDLFWACHDPTTPDRQGADVGSQYRSIIVVADEEQNQAALASRLRAQAKFSAPLVTEIVPRKPFYPAEPYHQDYYRRNKAAPYCQMVIGPKLAKMGPGR